MANAATGARKIPKGLTIFFTVSRPLDILFETIFKK